jgi:hypothetical protein
MAMILRSSQGDSHPLAPDLMCACSRRASLAHALPVLLAVSVLPGILARIFRWVQGASLWKSSL